MIIGIFSNHIFAKDFDDLFKISIEIKNENIENSIDHAFNDLVFRLIGYEDLEKAKIIKGNFNSKDFLTRYAVVRNNDSNFLQASFEEDIVMSQFIENGINFKNDIIKQIQPNIQLNSVWQYIRRYLLEIGVEDNYKSPYTSYSIPDNLKKDLTSLTKNVNLTLTPRQKSEKVVVKKHDWF